MSWSTIYDRPDLQIRAILVMLKEDYDFFYKNGVTNKNAIAFTDAAYNGGRRGVLLEMQACNLNKNCNPKIWFGNVEKHCMKSRQPLYGGRSACDINRHHVKDVLQVRSIKYAGFFQKR